MGQCDVHGKENLITYLDVLICLVRSKGTTVAQEVDEANSNAAIDVEDERVLLRRRDLLDGERVVEQAVAREVLAHVLLDKLDTQVRVVHALDLVADTADCGLRRDQLQMQKTNERWTY